MKCFGKHSATQRWSLKSFYLQRRLLKVLTHALTSTAETVSTHHPGTLHQESKHNHVQGKGALKLESHFQQHHH